MSRPPRPPKDRPPFKKGPRPERGFRGRSVSGEDRREPRREADAGEGDRPQRPWKMRNRPDRPDGGAERPFRPRGNRPDRPREDRPDHPKGERPDRPAGERPDRPRFGRPERRFPRPDRPRDERAEHGGDEPRSERRPPWLRKPDPEDEDRILIWGIHAVEAALRNPKREVRRLLLTENAAHRLMDALQTRSVTPEPVAPRDLDRELGNDTVHQGALLETGPLPEPALDEVLAASPSPLILVLDQVTDPHNVGAILRSAAAFGVAAVVMTRRHSPPSSGTLAKSASGALELVPLLKVANLARTLAELGEHYVTRLGLDGEAELTLEQEVSTLSPGPIALVLGAEERGLRRLTKDLCDRVVRLTTPGPLKSLNVSNAAAIAMHHVTIARGRM
ncbi:MAG: 23S rRNA (guanosine(2251)-2'-O)-methyltransferase RlmB [Hyphomicrobiaceae bacterium]